MPNSSPQQQKKHSCFVPISLCVVIPSNVRIMLRLYLNISEYINICDMYRVGVCGGRKRFYGCEIFIVCYYFCVAAAASAACAGDFHYAQSTPLGMRRIAYFTFVVGEAKWNRYIDRYVVYLHCSHRAHIFNFNIHVISFVHDMYWLVYSLISGLPGRLSSRYTFHSFRRCHSTIFSVRK